MKGSDFFCGKSLPFALFRINVLEYIAFSTVLGLRAREKVCVRDCAETLCGSLWRGGC